MFNDSFMQMNIIKHISLFYFTKTDMLGLKIFIECKNKMEQKLRVMIGDHGQAERHYLDHV